MLSFRVVTSFKFYIRSWHKALHTIQDPPNHGPAIVICLQHQEPVPLLHGQGGVRVGLKWALLLTSNIMVNIGHNNDIALANLVIIKSHSHSIRCLQLLH